MAIVFSANNGLGFELWRLRPDGTPTQQDINPGLAAGNPNLSDSAVLNGELYFSANDGAHGNEVWKMRADGSAALVSDQTLGAASSNPAGFTAYNGAVYFRGPGNNVFRALSDGTVAAVAGATIDTSSFTIFNNELYFRSAAVAGSASLMKIKADGTVAAGVTGGAPVTNFPDAMTVFNGELYFSADTVGNGTNNELFKLKADGTSVQIKEINVFGGSAFQPGGTVFTAYNGALYFRARDDGNGYEPWKTDGTTAGTVLVRNIRPGSLDSNPVGMIVYNSELYFSANDGTNGNNVRSLWKTKADGTSVKVTDAAQPAGYTSIGATAVFNNELYFASSVSGLSRLYKVTTGGSVAQVGGNGNGPLDVSFPDSFRIFNGELYFSAATVPAGGELFKVKADGTLALVADIVSGSGSSSPQFLTAFTIPVDIIQMNGGADIEAAQSFDVTGSTQVNGVLRIAFYGTAATALTFGAGQFIGSVAAPSVVGDAFANAITVSLRPSNGTNGAASLDLSSLVFTNWTAGVDTFAINDGLAHTGAQTIVTPSVFTTVALSSTSNTLTFGAGGGQVTVAGAGNNTVNAGPAAVGFTANGLLGGSGANTFNAGAGAASLSQNGGSLTVNGAPGNGAISVLGGALAMSVTTNSAAATVYAGAGGMFFTGNGGSSTVVGGAGGLTAYALGGNNYLQGGAASASDVLVATGAGTNTFYGGGGNNYIVGGTGTNTVVGGGGAFQTLYANGASGDVIIGGSGVGASNVLVENGTGAATLYGDLSGDNYIVGGANADVLLGGSGTNYLFGGDGADSIVGGTGTNYIFGGFGNDFIYTNPFGTQSAGFVYEGLGAGVDTIADFTPGNGAVHDTLVISAGTAIKSFADVQANAVQAGVYTVLTLGASDQVFLYNVQPFQLTANDFLFF